MTDEEILFDFYTVVAQQEEAKAQQTKQYEDEDEHDAGASSPVRVTPDNPMDQNRSKNVRVTADKKEFIRWYEAEVGPWPTNQHSTR